MKTRTLATVCVALLVPIALGATYAVGTGSDSGRAAVAMAETAAATHSVKAEVQAVAAAHRIARAKCSHLGAVERGNCRTEARAQAKHDLRVAKGSAPPE